MAIKKPESPGLEENTDYYSIFPVKRTRKYMGVEINITKIPVDVTLQMDEISQSGKTMTFANWLTFAGMVITANNPQIQDGEKWLKEVGDGGSIVEFVKDILAPTYSYSGVPLPNRISEKVILAISDKI